MDGQMFCTECGTKLEANTEFCTNCGTSVGGAAETKAHTSSSATARPVQRSSSRQWMFGAVAVATFALLGVVVTQYSSDPGSSEWALRLKIPSGKPTLSGKWYRVAQLQLGASTDPPFIELFKDNTLLHYETAKPYPGKYPGTWTDLEDGRVKMQVTGPLGRQMVSMGKLDDEGMLVEADFGSGRYVNGFAKAQEYALKRAPTGETIMALFHNQENKRYMDMHVPELTYSITSGDSQESGIKCKDYTVSVTYKSLNGTGMLSRQVKGFVCIDRDKNGAFKLAERKVSCVENSFFSGTPKECTL